MVNKNNEEQLYKVIENLKERVQRLEQKVEQIQSGFQSSYVNLYKQHSKISEIITILGILHHWFCSDFPEIKFYDQELLQNKIKQYYLNTEIELKNKEIIVKGEHKQKERIQKIRNHFIEKPLVRLSIKDIMNINHVCFDTAKNDMNVLIAEEPDYFEVVRSQVIRKHKNIKKQVVWIDTLACKKMISKN